LVGGHIIEEYLAENKIEQKKITINYPDDYTERLINSFSTSHNHPLYTQIIKHQLYKEHNIHIPFNIQFGEDLILLINIYYYAKKISSIPVYFYHYNKFNTNSLTYTHSKKQLIERIKYTDYMTSFALKNNILEIVGEDIAERKHIVRSLLLLQPELRDIKKAKHTYPEAKKEWRRFKQYYSKKNRFIFLLAEHGLYFLIKLIYRK